MIFRFGDFALDSERYELRRGGKVVAAEPKVLEVLVHLLIHRRRVVSKEELLAEIWDGRFVSDSALSRAVREVRRLLGDTAADSRWVKTVYGRGFSFVGKVAEEDRPGPIAEDRARAAGPAWPARLLPAPLTTLIGRDRELDEVCSLLTATRLLTLTGAAGTGKSRLALAVATRVAGLYADGAVFVSLAEVAEPELLSGALALAVGFTDAGGGSALEAVEIHLRERELLLIVDNFEHLVAAAPAVAGLLRACPRLTALVTSRFVLQVEGEQEYLVPPLSLPDRDAEPVAIETAPAVAMFLARARSALASFRPSEEELTSVVEICRRLDGLPLAIELAAARVKLFSPHELWQRLAERLDLLNIPSRSGTERHHGLEQALAWSYELLAEEERVLFCRLSVFAGGFCLAAVEQVCALGEGMLDLLAALVDKSLVERQSTATQEARFGLLETSRDFARERLREAGEEEALRAAHARWVLTLARRGEKQLTGGDQEGWLKRLDAEHGNLMAALDQARSGGDLEVGLATAAALARYWSARGGYREGRGELQALLGHPAAATIEPRVRADALVAHGMLCHLLCDFPCAQESLEQAQDLLRQLGDRPRLAQVLNNLGWVAAMRSRLDRAESISQEALALHRDLADDRGVAVALNNLGWVEFYRGKGVPAEEYFEESLAMRRSAGDERGVAFALANLAVTRLHRGGARAPLEGWAEEARILVDRFADPPLDAWVRCVEGALTTRRDPAAGGIATLRASAGSFREAGNTDGLAWALLFLGEAHEAGGESDAARACYQEMLEIWRGADTPWGVAEGLRHLAGLAKATGDSPAADELYRRSLDLGERFGLQAVAAACRAAVTAGQKANAP